MLGDSPPGLPPEFCTTMSSMILIPIHFDDYLRMSDYVQHQEPNRSRFYLNTCIDIFKVQRPSTPLEQWLYWLTVVSLYGPQASDLQDGSIVYCCRAAVTV